MSFCEWKSAAKGEPCIHCGFELPRDYEKPPMRGCGLAPALPQPTREEQEKLLGDKTRELLESVGIDKDLYIGIKAALGFAPTCDCDTRAEWLNKAHAWVKKKLRGVPR